MDDLQRKTQKQKLHEGQLRDLCGILALNGGQWKVCERRLAQHAQIAQPAASIPPAPRGTNRPWMWIEVIPSGSASVIWEQVNELISQGLSPELIEFAAPKQTPRMTGWPRWNQCSTKSAGVEVRLCDPFAMWRYLESGYIILYMYIQYIHCRGAKARPLHRKPQGVATHTEVLNRPQSRMEARRRSLYHYYKNSDRASAPHAARTWPQRVARVRRLVTRLVSLFEC
ncbi:predicted protein [Histoplasma capsulatum H143]|uniref:Uncharacterized protein n=1 Tax=Ajellomyces capsulatus (strain H143) TaxID=544712 RepID=C6HCB0_AJECH|nr:predicted protein [Histoplasma capsulatum H143]